MMSAEDGFLFFGVDVCVDLCGSEGAVAENGLDVFDVDAFFEQEGGKGMAEGVRGDVLGDAGLGSDFLNHESD